MAQIPILELSDELIENVNRIAKALNTTGLTEKATVILLQDAIGPRKITRDQVLAVLRAIPQLQRLYIKDKK